MINVSGTRYVAHLDVLGMSSLVGSDFERAWSVLSELVAVKDKAFAHAYEFVAEKVTLQPSERIGTVVFSDTILLYTRGSSILELKSLIILVTEIFHKALYRCVPVRVGIAKGLFRADEGRSIYAGPALIDAYRVGEASQWLGLVLSDPLAMEALALGMKTGSKDLLVRWSVPTKTGPSERVVVNWPAAFAHDFTVQPPILLDQFYRAFELSFGAFANLPAEVQRKYTHTVDFINFQLASCHAA